MAKRPPKTKTRAKDAEDKTTPTAADNMLFPPSDLIRKLAKDGAKATKASREIIGAFGSQVSEAADKKHVDKKALGMGRQLNDMSDERLAITLPHLLRYIDDMGLVARANKQASLFEEPRTEASEGDDAGEGQGDGQVHRIGRAARKVMEQAGATPSAD